ncbi:MAG: phospholipase [Actinobacteria bacterium]|nr:phospholipase [Actinomycetota bacterium]
MTDWSRRQVLGATAGWALAAAAAACAGDEGEPTGASAPGAPVTPVATPPASPVVSPVTTPATVSGVSGSLNDVEHVVIFFQENRSFDHYFGTRPGSRGFGDAAAGAGADSVWYQPYEGSSDGYLLPYRLDTASTSGACGPDPDHTWAGQHAAWNGGRNDGFGRTMGSSALGYFARADLPFYSALADEFTLCDQYFCSVIGPTTPNRLYSLSATIDPGGAGGGPVIDNLTGPFAWTTYPERLQKAGVSWRVYHEADDYDDNPLKFFTAFQNLETSDPLFDAAIRNRPADAFVNDVLAGDLPQVSWIVAPTVVSEHPPFPPAVGEDMSATILAALMSKPEVWAKTVFILSYDENGGYFDHVVPPTPSAGTVGEFVGELPIGLGFRVPTTVVSPWSRGGRVCSDVFDHTSTLLFLERRFGVEVPNLSQWRRDTCGDLTTALDFAGFDSSVPTLPGTAERAAAVLSGCHTLPAATPPTEQALPTTEGD